MAREYKITKIEVNYNEDGNVDPTFYFEHRGEEPFSVTEFPPGSPTRILLAVIEDAIISLSEKY